MIYVLSTRHFRSRKSTFGNYEITTGTNGGLEGFIGAVFPARRLFLVCIGGMGHLRVGSLSKRHFASRLEVAFPHSCTYGDVSALVTMFLMPWG